jgi:drug/metabolite transporter (DMT)-like permease
MLWALFTLIGAAGQTARNAMQRELTATLGTVGATHVRFLFGFPFALLFLAAVRVATGTPFPAPDLPFWGWALLAALSQILATGLMLGAMRDRSFVVATAYIKTEPVQVAVFGLAFLGDALTLPIVVAILIATSGVVLTSLKPGQQLHGYRPLALGLAAAAMFALAAVGFRGAIISLATPSFVMAATFTLAVGLLMQSAILSAYLMWREPAVLTAIARAWKPSLFAGFTGALASQFWFLAFALASAASVRTLALIEVLFAQGVARFVFKQQTTPREAMGIALIVVGVILLLWAH